jgi:hypothetical protein
MEAINAPATPFRKLLSLGAPGFAAVRSGNGFARAGATAATGAGAGGASERLIRIASDGAGGGGTAGFCGSCSLMRTFARAVESTPQPGHFTSHGIRPFTGSTANSNGCPQAHSIFISIEVSTDSRLQAENCPSPKIAQVFSWHFSLKPPRPCPKVFAS